MDKTVPFRLVDAFAVRPFSGNSAGVVLEADGLSDQQMQTIAREINVSETAFISRLNDLHRPPLLRWFAPGAEVSFCGHATLAAAHALGEAGLLDKPPKQSSTAEGTARRVTAQGTILREEKTVVLEAPRGNMTCALESAAGVLSLQREILPNPDEAPLWWLQMPEPGLRPDHTNPMHTCKLLGLHIDDLEPAVPVMRTRDDDLILLIKSWQRLMEMKPNFQELAAWSVQHKLRGICVATLNTLSKATSVHSRFFAPAVGIYEDPVTGSVHGPLATLLVVNELVPVAGGRAALNCLQGGPGGRTGLVRALVEAASQGYRVAIAGQCYTTVTGELRVPCEQ